MGVFIGIVELEGLGVSEVARLIGGSERMDDTLKLLVLRASKVDLGDIKTGAVDLLAESFLFSLMDLSAPKEKRDAMACNCLRVDRGAAVGAGIALSESKREADWAINPDAAPFDVTSIGIMEHASFLRSATP